MEALVFPSEAWVAEWASRCNASGAFLAAAHGWNGAVTLEICPDGGSLTRPVFIRLSGEDGRWNSIQFGSNRVLAENSVFLLRASLVTWKRLVRQEIAPLPAIIKGAVRVEGQLSEFLRWAESLRVVTELAGQVDTVFADEA